MQRDRIFLFLSSPKVSIPISLYPIHTHLMKKTAHLLLSNFLRLHMRNKMWEEVQHMQHSVFLLVDKAPEPISARLSIKFLSY